MVDEGHRLKNPSCKLGIVLRTLKTDGRLLLTGARHLHQLPLQTGTGTQYSC